MIGRRGMLAGGGSLLLAGCVAPLVEEAGAGPLSVADIFVSTSEVEGVTGREFAVPPAQLQRDVETALRGALVGRGQPGGRPVRVRIAVERVALVSPGQALLVGGSSTIRGRLDVRDAATGEAVIPATAVTGTGGGYAPGGIIGAIARPTPERDYQNTVASFAQDVRLRLFGRDAA